MDSNGKGHRIAFVPTMGALHEGHMSLVRRAKEISDITVVSIFVNPAQFSPLEDLGKYPRTFERDADLCRKENVDVIFYPDADQIYSDDHTVYIEEAVLSGSLCGASRPGHFRGVLTVVAKLFNLIQPSVAVFGQKDAQQAILIQRMVHDLNFPVKIIVAPILREPDGLAMSSRNVYLSPDERARALCLHQALCAAQDMLRNGEKEAMSVTKKMKQTIEQGGGVIDYIEIVDYDTLKPVSIMDGKVLIAIAVFIGKTRLIDNIVIDSQVLQA